MNSQSDTIRQDYYNDDTYYKLLGVEPDASTQDIKRAYRRLSLLYHPDKHNDDAEKSHRFRLLNEAYRILGDQRSRAKYNRDNRLGSQCQSFIGSDDYYGDYNYQEEEIRVDNSQQYDIRDRRYHDSSNRFRENDRIRRDMQMTDRMTDRMTDCFAKRVTNRECNKPYVKAIEIVKEIDLQQSYNGATIPILINRVIVDTYNGNGISNGISNSNGYDRSTINETETVYIDIPVGTDDGEIIVIREKGNIINGINGDIRVKIKLNIDIGIDTSNRNNGFSRDGLDLVYTKKITLKESLCGFTFCLKHINGREYTINNNTGIVINPNSTTIIPKLGFVKANRKHNDSDDHSKIGCLKIKYIIEYPERIDGETRKRLSEIL